MNEWYARDISKKIRSAYHTKALNGEFTGPYPPYGYSKHRKENNRLVINFKQSKIVKRIYSLYLEGKSIYKISKILKQEGILTPRAELYYSTSKYKSSNIEQYPYDWPTKTIVNILENEEYTGCIICNKNQTRSFKSKKLIRNAEDKWIISKNKHEAIIESDVFSRVRKMINKNKKTPRTSHENIFKGKIRCVQCGKTLTLSIRPERKAYGTYDCSTYRRFGKVRCNSHYITYEYLYNEILNDINKTINIAKNGLGCLYRHLDRFNRIKEQINDLNAKIKEKEERLQEVKELIKKLYEKYILEKIEENKFYVLDKSYDEERKSLMKDIKNHQMQLSEINKYEEKVKSFIQLVSKYNKLHELNQTIIDELIEKVEVTNEKDSVNHRKLVIYYNLISKM